MLRQKATGNNGHSRMPPTVFDYVPEPLRKRIEVAFEEEGMMEQSAERRILEAINANHRELTNTLHGHDNRLVLVEAEVKDFKQAQADAAEERRQTTRLVKGAIITSLVGILIGVFASFYGPRAAPPPAVQETVKQEAANASDLKDLIKEIRQDREDRKAEQATVNVPQTKSRTTKPRPPGPFLNQLRDGEMRANEKVWDTYASLRYLSTPEERP